MPGVAGEPWRAALDTALRLRATAHRQVFTLSRGRLLRRWGGVPVLLLTTTGRRTGRPRSTVLVTPARDGDGLVVVASNGGAPRDPLWYANLVADPRAEVLVDGRRRRVLARTVQGPEREALWAQVVARSPAYARYQERTERTLPLVLLTPGS